MIKKKLRNAFFVLYFVALPVMLPSFILTRSSEIEGEENYQLLATTFLGGSGDDKIRDMATDSEGNIVVVGETDSYNLPATPNVFQTRQGGSTDVFLAKISPNGNQILFLTYFGGAEMDIGTGLGIDSQNNIWVCGATNSWNFPISSNATQPQGGGGSMNGFIAKFSPDGHNLLYSSYFGGVSFDWCYGGVVDSYDNFICTGHFASSNFAVGNVFQPIIGSASGENGDAMVIKSNPNGTIEFATYIGGNDWDWGINVDVDSSNNIIVGGHTKSTNFPTTHDDGATFEGDQDSFVSYLSSNGSKMLFSRYFGGEGIEACTGIKFDAHDDIILSGYTTSADFPILNALNSTLNGGRDIFVSKINQNTLDLNFSTFLGGVGTDGKAGDHGESLVLSQNGDINVIGSTNSADFPVINAGQAEINANSTDTCFFKLSNDGQTLKYSTFYGGNDKDSGNAVAISLSDLPIIAGVSTSEIIYDVDSLYSINQGGEDTFLAIMKEGVGVFGSQENRVISRVLDLDLIVILISILGVAMIRLPKKKLMN